MKLVAKIERSQDSRGRKQVRFTFPKGARPFMREDVLQRNLGPRPYGEGFFTKDNGEAVTFYWKA